MPLYSYDRFARPEIFLSEVLEKAFKGKYLERGGHLPFMYRAVVVAVDVEGGKLENEDGQGGVTHDIDGKSVDFPARVGPSNPQNSLKARIITDGLDRFVHDDRLRVFWPFFPEHDTLPIKPGEYVYVTFEDEHARHGLWIAKVAGHEGTNFARGKDFWKEPSSDSLKEKFGAHVSGNSDEPEDDATESRADGKLTKIFGGG